MIRHAVLGDVQGIINLLEYLAPVGDESYIASTFYKSQAKDDCITLVWELDEGLVCVGSVWFMQKLIRECGIVAQIEDVVTHPDYRGCGFGKMIIEELVREARDRGAYKVILNCSDENIPFYEKCGFTRKENQMRIDL